MHSTMLIVPAESTLWLTPACVILTHITFDVCKVQWQTFMQGVLNVKSCLSSILFGEGDYTT